MTWTRGGGRTIIRVLGLFVSLLFSVGAVLGAAGGVLGGLLPALRASRLSILAVLRA